VCPGSLTCEGGVGRSAAWLSQQTENLSSIFYCLLSQNKNALSCPRPSSPPGPPPLLKDLAFAVTTRSGTPHGCTTGPQRRRNFALSLMPTEMPARDESSRAAVIEKCAKLIREYNPILLTVDSFAAERLGKDCEGKVRITIHFAHSRGNEVSMWAVYAAECRPGQSLDQAGLLWLHHETQASKGTFSLHNTKYDGEDGTHLCRRRSLLQVFLTHFYGDLAAYVLRSDYVLYQIFAYLIIFRWESLHAWLRDLISE
jgi:hypothetical protein